MQSYITALASFGMVSHRVTRPRNTKSSHVHFHGITCIHSFTCLYLQCICIMVLLVPTSNDQVRAFGLSIYINQSAYIYIYIYIYILKYNSTFKKYTKLNHKNFNTHDFNFLFSFLFLSSISHHYQYLHVYMRNSKKACMAEMFNQPFQFCYE